MTEGTVLVPRRRNQAAAERAEQAAAMRVEGADWATIAEATGYSHGTHAARAVREYLGSTPAPDRETARATWRQRVEDLWHEAFEDVLARRPGAVRAAAAIAQRASQLDGLDAPTQLQLHSPSESEYAQVLHTLLDLHREQTGTQLGLEADLFAPEYLDAEVVDSGEADPFRTPRR